MPVGGADAISTENPDDDTENTYYSGNAPGYNQYLQQQQEQPEKDNGDNEC